MPIYFPLFWKPTFRLIEVETWKDLQRLVRETFDHPALKVTAISHIHLAGKSGKLFYGLLSPSYFRDGKHLQRMWKTQFQHQRERRNCNSDTKKRGFGSFLYSKPLHIHALHK